MHRSFSGSGADHGPARRRLLPALLVTLALASVACGTDEDRAPGTPDGGSAATVSVVYGSQTITVDLGKATPVTLDGASYARLSDVALLALPKTSLDMLTADFESSDGFKPASKDYCKSIIPLAGGTLSKGYVQLTSRNVRWDDSLGFPGCMSVSDLARLILADD